MKRAITIAMFALAAIATPAIAQDKGMKNPEARKARQERMMDKLNFTSEQRAQVIKLNDKYEGIEFNRDQYKAEFATILTEPQKQQMEEMKAKRKSKMNKKGKKMQ